MIITKTPFRIHLAFVSCEYHDDLCARVLNNFHSPYTNLLLIGKKNQFLWEKLW